MKNKIKKPYHTKEVLAPLVEQGLTTMQIGNIFNVDDSTISIWLKRNNLATKLMNTYSYVCSEELKEKVKAIAETKATLDEMITELGVCEKVVRKLLKEFNLTTAYQREYSKPKIKDCPELMKEWSFEKNGGGPGDLGSGSGKKAWFTCSTCKSDWHANIAARKQGFGAGCPNCSANQYTTLTPERSLAVVCPEVAAEWHPELNGDIQPTQVSYGSGLHYWWKCKKGHVWKKSIAGRTINGYVGCPKCNNKTKKQYLLYTIIQELFPDCEVKYNHKHPEIKKLTGSRLEFDIWIETFLVAVEYQGQFHFLPLFGEKSLKEQQERDEKKRQACKQLGINLIEIDYHWDKSKEQVIEHLKTFLLSKTA